MNIELTWNLFVSAFFILIMAYSFIVGNNQTIKIILGTYLAAFTADAMSNYFHKYFLIYSPIVNSLSTELVNKYFLAFKIILFILIIVIFVVKANIGVMIDSFDSMIIRSILMIVMGVFSAGLIVSIILQFVSGFSFINTLPIATDNTMIATLSAESRFVRIMIQNYNLWFGLPALTIIFLSFVSTEETA